MNLKQFIKNFDSKNRSWDSLPDGFPKCNLDDLSSDEIRQFNIIKTFWEIDQPKKPKSRSRVWKSPNAYIYLVAWSNANLLRVLGVRWFNWLVSSPQSPLRIKGDYRRLKEAKGKRLRSSKLLQSPPKSYKFGYKYIDRLEGQFLDELRSTVANIEEGFARPTTSSYLDFLGYSQGSLKEAKGDVQRSRQDGLLKSIPSSSLKDLEIDLKDWHEALKKTVISRPLKSSKSKGFYRNLKDSRGEPFGFGYPPVDNIDPAELTYEIFIELVNKTDWHLRKLVESLEKKMDKERKGYQVEKARIKGKAKGR